MLYYFIFDFYLQTEKGLKQLKQSSGFDNIDPWDEMSEDIDSITSGFFGCFQLEIDRVLQTKISNKFIARFVVKSETPLEEFYARSFEKLYKLRNEGWAPFGVSGCAYSIAQVNMKQVNYYTQSNKEIDGREITIIKLP